MIESRLEKVLTRIAATVIGIWVLFPIAWMINISLQSEAEVHTAPPYYFPPNPSIQSYWYIFHVREAIEARLKASGIFFLPAVVKDFPQACINSSIVGITVMIINVFLGLLASYIFTRVRFRGSNALFYMSVSGRLIPPVVVVVPFYMIILSLKLVNTLLAVILIHTAFTLPFTIWILNSYMGALRKDAEEAAALDGCSRLGIVFRIVLPIMTPALLAVGIIAFMVSWGEFFFALVITQSAAARTVPVIAGFVAADPAMPVSLMAAIGIVAMLPPLFIIAIFRQYVLRGLTGTTGTI